MISLYSLRRAATEAIRQSQLPPTSGQILAAASAPQPHGFSQHIPPPGLSNPDPRHQKPLPVKVDDDGNVVCPSCEHPWMEAYATTVSQQSVLACCAYNQVKLAQDVDFGNETASDIAIVTSLQCLLCADVWVVSTRNVHQHERMTRVELSMVLLFEGTPTEGAFDHGKPRRYAGDTS